MAKKQGKYLKGAQGDAQIDTDVSGGIGQSTAHVAVASSDSKKHNKRRKR